MLATVYRNTTIKSVKSLVPKVGATSAISYNFVSRRFKSDDAAEERESSSHTDSLMNIIVGSLGASSSGSTANEQFRMARGNFHKGDIYKPSDLNDSKPITYAPTPKPVDQLKILKLNPLIEYKNAALLSHYITPFGRLMSKEQTGLSSKNQRRVSKAVRRARAMCIISPTAKLH
ncbi:hypothetical protein FBU30_001272 [Linnemannia zychae]|nr:hypothetical protein FBU30_001272 [Linnemannia zychae]